MTLELPEEKLDADVFIGEIRNMTPEQLEDWIKGFRDNELLKKVRDMLQAEIISLPVGEEKKELGGKMQVIRDRIIKNKKIIGADQHLKTGGLSAKKKEYNV